MVKNQSVANIYSILNQIIGKSSKVIETAIEKCGKLINETNHRYGESQEDEITMVQ